MAMLLYYVVRHYRHFILQRQILIVGLLLVSTWQPNIYLYVFDKAGGRIFSAFSPSYL